MWKIIVENPQEKGFKIRQVEEGSNLIKRLGFREGQSYCFIDGYFLGEEKPGRFVSEDLDDGAHAHLSSVLHVDDIKYEDYRI